MDRVRVMYDDKSADKPSVYEVTALEIWEAHQRAGTRIVFARRVDTGRRVLCWLDSLTVIVERPWVCGGGRRVEG